VRNAVARFENVSRKFIIHHQKARSLQESLVNLFHRRNGTTEEFWALRDVSFELYPGETLGIIGANGSGKSTILKMLTRILEPTAGKVTVQGKVSALIELGAGFHQDLTGRENIFLNGSILGLSRREMAGKFDEIVAFSELERFIDTPIKHFSSGMYARLGFAVAVSVDPEILIIDEVLSVGDEIFQRKCMERIEEFRRHGKTIIFVSHDLAAVEKLCDRVIWMQNGTAVVQGAAALTVQSYLADSQRRDEQSRAVDHQVVVEQHQKGVQASNRDTDVAKISDVKLTTAEREERYTFRTGETLVARMHYWLEDPTAEHVIAVELRRADGLLIATLSCDIEGRSTFKPSHNNVIEVEIPALPVLAGSYELTTSIRRRLTRSQSSWPVTGPTCRFSVWADLDQTGIVVLSHRWSSPTRDLAPTGSDHQPLNGVGVAPRAST
jgi:ABC-type polysaccharide/polyol phosphate transport system ATPase subunit